MHLSPNLMYFMYGFIFLYIPKSSIRMISVAIKVDVNVKINIPSTPVEIYANTNRNFDTIIIHHIFIKRNIS